MPSLDHTKFSSFLPKLEMEPYEKIIKQIESKNARWRIFNSTVEHLQDVCQCTFDYKPLMKGTCDNCFAEIVNGAYCNQHDKYYCLECIAAGYKRNHRLSQFKTIFEMGKYYLTVTKCSDAAQVYTDDDIRISSEHTPSEFSATLVSDKDDRYYLAIKQNDKFLQPHNDGVSLIRNTFLWHAFVNPLSVEFSSSGMQQLNLLLFDKTGSVLSAALDTESEMFKLELKSSWIHYFTIRLMPVAGWNETLQRHENSDWSAPALPLNDETRESSADLMDVADEDAETEPIVDLAESMSQMSVVRSPSIDAVTDGDEMQNAEKMTFSWEASQTPLLSEITHRDLLFELAIPPDEPLNPHQFKQKDYDVQSGLKKHFYDLLVQCQLFRQQASSNYTQKLNKNHPYSSRIEDCIKRLYSATAKIQRVNPFVSLHANSTF